MPTDHQGHGGPARGQHVGTVASVATGSLAQNYPSKTVRPDPLRKPYGYMNTSDTEQAELLVVKAVVNNIEGEN